MIYQSLVELAKYSPLWIIWLVAAMFGSAFTLASFIKLTHAVFLGQWSVATAKAREVHWLMWLPMIALAAVCVVFGIFASGLPLRYLIAPTVGKIPYIGLWEPGTATWLILLGLAVGLLIYWLGAARKVTVKPIFIGGEVLPEETVKVSGVDFYDTIKNWGPLGWIYEAAGNRLFDIYEQGTKLCFGLAGALSWLHDGLLQNYLAWMILGVILLGDLFVKIKEQ